MINTYVKLKVYSGLALMLLALFNSAFAQLHYTAIKAPAETYKCNQDGKDRIIYTGPLSPHAGRLQTEDPYVWFVNQEFADRFCMPRQFISNELKGALAIAAGLVKAPQFKICGHTKEGNFVCNVPQHLMLDIYIDNTKTYIPKGDPSVGFYSGWQETSADTFTYRFWRREERRKGNVLELPGEKRAFKPFGEATDSSVIFSLFSIRGSWASPQGILREEYYRENWLPGIDFIRLSFDTLLGTMSNPETNEPNRYVPEPSIPITGWAIAAFNEKEVFSKENGNENLWRSTPFPKGYLHTINIPLDLLKLIYQIDKRQGDAFELEIKRRLNSLSNK